MIILRAQTKVRANNKFELVYLVREKEKDGWVRGKMFKEDKRFKYFSRNKFGSKYAGDDVQEEWVCHMEKEFAEIGVK